jgi:hypothetical protein
MSQAPVRLRNRGVNSRGTLRATRLGVLLVALVSVPAGWIIWPGDQVPPLETQIPGDFSAAVQNVLPLRADVHPGDGDRQTIESDPSFAHPEDWDDAEEDEEDDDHPSSSVQGTPEIHLAERLAPESVLAWSEIAPESCLFLTLRRFRC